MGINERIIQYLVSKSITKYRFYKETGLSNGFLDKKGNIGSDKCEIIAKCYPDLNIEWAITGNGYMFKNEVACNKNSEDKIEKENVESLNKPSTHVDFDINKEKEMRISELKEVISVQRELIDELKKKFLNSPLTT
jgi:hypothetical protein